MQDIISSTLPEKQCKDCLKVFAATPKFFYRAKGTHDRLSSRCKKCQKELDHIKYSLAKKQSTKEPPPSYLFCPECKQTRSSDLFHKSPTGKYGLSTYCKDCVQKRTEQYYQSPHGQTVRKANDARYYAEHREHRLEQHSQWYQENRERVLEKDRQFRIDHPEILAERWQRWYQTENGKEHCRIRVRNRRARKKSTEGTYTYDDIQEQHRRQKGKCYWCGKKLDKYHIDHIVPLNRGGTNWPWNIVLACRRCNTSRQNKLPHEWPQGGRLL